MGSAAVPVTTPVPETLDGCTNEMPTHTQYVRVLTEVVTTEDKIPQLWEKISEYNIAVKFGEECLPPPLMDYPYDIGSASNRSGSNPLLLLITTSLWALLCGRSHLI